MNTNWFFWCLKLFTVKGIDVVIHWSTILYSLYFGMFTESLLIVLGLFFFVTLHELTHSLTASQFDLKTEKIYLIPLGGVASIPGLQKALPWAEFVVTISGPLLSLFLALFFFIVLVNVNSLGPANLLGYLVMINLMIGVFNLMPIFPLDGGRVLRSFLAFFMEYCLATLIAVRLGQFLAVILIGYGFYTHHSSLIFIMFICFFHSFDELDWLKKNGGPK